MSAVPKPLSRERVEELERLVNFAVSTTKGRPSLAHEGLREALADRARLEREYAGALQIVQVLAAGIAGGADNIVDSRLADDDPLMVVTTARVVRAARALMDLP